MFLMAPKFLVAAGEVEISNVAYTDVAADRFDVAGTLTNSSSETREVVVRAQMTLYDRAAPRGDKPIAVIQKDTTHILKASETRDIRVRLINEGSPIRESIRKEPMMRIRRNRVWHY